MGNPLEPRGRSPQDSAVPPTTWSRSFLGYLPLFAVFAFPWLRHAADAIPTGAPIISTVDARLIIWILGWVSHALASNPTGILDANILYPAPAQLLGSEHLATSQLAFGPIVWLTDNAVLAANLAAFATYPIAAVAMERLVLASGCPPPRRRGSRALPSHSGRCVYRPTCKSCSTRTSGCRSLRWRSRACASVRPADAPQSSALCCCWRS